MGIGARLEIPLKYEHGVCFSSLLISSMFVPLYRRLPAYHDPAMSIPISAAYEDILVKQHLHTTMHIASIIAGSSSLVIML